MKILGLNFDTVIKYAKPYKKELLIAAVFVLFENAIQLILPVFYGKAIDIVIDKKDLTREVFILILSWFILSLLSEFFTRIRTRKGVQIGYKAAVDLFTNSIFHLIRLPLAFHKKRKVGEIIERFDRADEYLGRIISDGFLQVVPHLITSVLALFVILWIKWELAVVYAIFITVFVIITIKKTNPIISYNKKIDAQYEKVYGNIYERTPNVLTIKANVSEEKEYKSNRKEYARIFFDIDQYSRLWLYLQFWQRFIFVTGFLLLFLTGLYMVKLELITIGDLVILLVYVNMASVSIQTLGTNYKDLQEGMVAIARAEKTNRESEEDYGGKEAQKIENCEGFIEFENVSFSDKGREILKNITFKARPGKMIAVVGRSGQGKSTILNLIPRFIEPTKGKIKLDGVDLKKLKLEDLRKNIGIVSDEMGLFHDSIKNNIRYSRTSAKVDEIYRSSRIAHCHEFVTKFPRSYDTIIGDRGIRLSSGQRQRLAIARAVLRDPKILILDEATNALDSESEKFIQESLEKVMEGRTTFVIAHRLSTIRKADLILVIEGGKIVERGDHAELLRHGGVYKKLHELQHVKV